MCGRTNAATMAPTGRPKNRQRSTKMSRAIFGLILLTTLSVQASSQSQPTIDRMIRMIKTVPAKYNRQNTGPIQFPPRTAPTPDFWWDCIVHYDTSAIKYLAQRITDTTETSIPIECTTLNYRIGDLAILLINDIEQIPWAAVTNIQWCIFSRCSMLPEAFLEWVATNRAKFRSQYLTYWASEERREILWEHRKRNRQATKKKTRQIS